MLSRSNRRKERNNTYVCKTFCEEPPGTVPFELVTAQLRKGRPQRTGHVFHDLRLDPIDLDILWRRAVCRVLGIGSADIRDFQHHIALVSFSWVLVPERDTDILHAITLQSSILQEVRVDGDFALEECVVWNPARRLIRIIAFALAPYAGG